MLVVLAGPEDPAVSRFLDAWPGEACRLGPSDLSRPGWTLEPGGGPGWAVVAGERVPDGEIDAVITQLPCVTPAELGAIDPADRDYVAAEMTAFLVAWLDGLGCPVLNRPRPGALMGPPWSAGRWASVARAAGVGTRVETISLDPLGAESVVSARAGVRASPGSETVAPVQAGETVAPIATGQVVTIVGGRALGAAEPACAAAAEALAGLADVALLRAHFTGAQDERAFAGADYWVDIADHEVIAAIGDVLEELDR